MTALLWVGIGAGLLVAAYTVTHWRPLVRRQRRWAWRSVKQASELSEGLAGRWIRTRRWTRLSIATLVNRWTATPLHIETLSSETDEIDGAVVAEVLRSEIAHIASLGPTVPSMVATPFVARPLLSEVAEAVSTVPQGRLIAPLISLLGRAVRRDELTLRGGVLLSERRGPGLSLSIARANGELVDSLTVWADEYEPRHARSEEARADVSGRAMRVTTATAVWTHFAVLRFRLALPESEYRAQLGTPSWQSFAYLRAGAQARTVPKPEPLARALFARSADTDPRNLPAQFNLALMEAIEREEGGAMNRLESIRGQLPAEPLASRMADALLSDRATLDRDPFRYQVMSLWASAALNRFFRQTDRGKNVEGEAGRKALVDLQRVWIELTEELVSLEAALAILSDDGKVAATGNPGSAKAGALKKMDRARARRGRRWKRGALSRSDSEQLVLGEFLERIEPPMLLRWAMMGLEIGHHTENEALTGRAARGGELDRVTLARGLDSWARENRGALRPDAAVEHFLQVRARLDGNARYELACYYAQIGDTEKALEELRQSFDFGEHRTAWANGDPQLTAVTATAEYLALIERYSDRSSLSEPPRWSRGAKALSALARRSTGLR